MDPNDPLDVPRLDMIDLLEPHNPYEPPKAPVEDPAPETAGTLLDIPRRVGAGHGLTWVAEGWRLFRQAPGTWIGVTFLLALLLFVFNFIPFVNLLSGIINPILVGGLMAGCHALARFEDFRVGHVFAGFRDNFGKLATVGLVSTAGTLFVVVAVAIGVLGTTGMSAVLMGEAGHHLPDANLALMGALIALALVLPMLMAAWFAPALVMLHDELALEAMGFSLRGCLSNVLPFLVNGMALLVLAVLASIPLGVGWLVLVPVMIGSTYAAYRDIFIA